MWSVDIYGKKKKLVVESEEPAPFTDLATDKAPAWFSNGALQLYHSGPDFDSPNAQKQFSWQVNAQDKAWLEAAGLPSSMIEAFSRSDSGLVSSEPVRSPTTVASSMRDRLGAGVLTCRTI